LDIIEGNNMSTNYRIKYLYGSLFLLLGVSVKSVTAMHDYVYQTHSSYLTPEQEKDKNMKKILAENKALEKECPICFEDMAADAERQPQKLSCTHVLCLTCFNDMQSKNKNCPTCEKPLELAPIEPVQQEQSNNQTQEHTEEIDKILLQLVKELAYLERNDILATVLDAYNNPLILLDHAFISVLNDSQKILVNQLAFLATNKQNEPDLPVLAQPIPNQEALSEQGRTLLQQLSSSLAPLEDDEIDDLLIQAYSNPLVLMENGVFMSKLTMEQQFLLSTLVDEWYESQRA
jgi:zinc-RING finger domain